jgi:O-antigen ligase
VFERAVPGFIALAIFGALAVTNVWLGAMYADARNTAVTLAMVPVVLVAIGSLIASNRTVLIFAAFALNLFSPFTPEGALPLPGGINLYPADILVLLAVASWVAAWLINPAETRPSTLRTRVLGWPLLLFGVILFATVVRGHERYGEELFGVPLRLVLYAGIAAAVTDLTPRDAYKWLVGLFYAGAVWQSLLAVYGYATGTSTTNQVALSTGGERVLAGSTAMFMAGALLLALLNVERDRSARRTALHLAIAMLATFALVSTFQRSTFAAVGVLVPLFLFAFRRIGLRIAAYLPLLAPFLVMVALLVPKADQKLFPTLANRITASPSTDATATWRLKAYSSVWAQVREEPLLGVGFGRRTRFISKDVHYNVTQNPHNQFLYLWAAGGSLLFGSFILLLAVYLIESWRRFRAATGDERRLIFWAVSLWFVFVVNSATGIVLTQSHLLLSFWVLMVLPMIVRPDRSGVTAPA